MPLITYKKRRRIFPFTPTEDPQRRLEQMHSLAFALIELQVEFSNGLTCLEPRYTNKANLEKNGMQVQTFV